VRPPLIIGVRSYSPCSVPLSTLVKVAGSRWTVEETFQSSKTLAGLDEHQVRRRDSWHRWVTLALLAHAFLAITAAIERRDQTLTDDGTSPNGLIPLTCNQIQRLFTALITKPTRDLAHRLRWSTDAKPPFSREDPPLRREHQWRPPQVRRLTGTWFDPMDARSSSLSPAAARMRWTMSFLPAP
jgi:hypothetical protein